MPNKDKPVIYGPLGPVKSSRGPDLVRSDRFAIVGSIKDLEDQSVPDGRSKSSTSLLPPSANASALPGRSSPAEDKPLPPLPVDPVGNPPQPPRQPGKLPRSRTVNVLDELKKPFSRPNANARFSEAARAKAPAAAGPRLPPAPPVPGPSRIPGPPQGPGPARAPAPAQQLPPWQRPVPPRKPVPTRLPAPSTTAAASQGSRRPATARLPSAWSHSSLAPPSSSSSSSKASSSSKVKEAQRHSWAAPSSRHQSIQTASPSGCSAPDQERMQVTAAEPMEYWTGRFSRLNDLYLGLGRAPETLLTLRSGLLSQNRYRVDPQTVSQDDARHLHIFAQLESLCLTPEARRSLREFRQTFARRVNRPILLPEGGTMTDGDRGLRSRFFSTRRASGNRSGESSSSQRPSAHGPSASFQAPGTNAGCPSGMI
ncbi:hypothetical protein CDD83_6622 [Cordyceps sp. RAO-2017]|nr:hypothetical protein CDD83_6622 [Cordyceps sp. RAO-2017]